MRTKVKGEKREGKGGVSKGRMEGKGRMTLFLPLRLPLPFRRLPIMPEGTLLVPEMRPKAQMDQGSTLVKRNGKITVLKMEVSSGKK